MKVLFVLCNLDRGGTETQAVELSKRLSSAGCEVTVATFQDGPLRSLLQQAGIRTVDFPKKGGLISVRGAYQFLRLWRFIQKEKFDVVHSHDLWSNLLAVPAAKFARVPVVLSSQRDLAHLYWYTPSRKKVIGRIHRWASGVVVNSSAVSELVHNEFQVPVGRIHLIHNGVAFERFVQARTNRKKLLPGINGDATLIVTVANMHSAGKGHYEILEVAQRVKSLFSKAIFLFVGDGAERSSLEERARTLGVADSVVFLGQRGDIPELLGCCDIFVLASRAEGLPNSILEALATGLPVVATRVGGVPDVIVDEFSGLLVPAQDPNALGDALLRVLGDVELAAKLARGGRERARSRFAFERVVEELESVYEGQKR